MKTIWKYQLTETDECGICEIKVPPQSELLHVATQNNIPCLWFLVGHSSIGEVKRRCFKMCGTGHQVPDSFSKTGLYNKHVGTVMTDDQTLVLHIFEVT